MIPGTPDPTWESVALSAIGTLAQQGRPFTAWDVATLIHHEPDHPNRWGSVLAKAKAIGLIRRIALGHDPLQTLHTLLIAPVSDLYGVSELLVKENAPVNDMGWEIYPHGIYRICKKYWAAR